MSEWRDLPEIPALEQYTTRCAKLTAPEFTGGNMIKSNKLISKPKPLFRLEDCKIVSDQNQRIAFCNLNLYGKDISTSLVAQIENPRVTIEMLGEELDTESPDIEDYLVSLYQDEREGSYVDDQIDRRKERDAA